MSDTSLYSGVYEQVREYAELVDSVIIELKDRTSLPNDTARQKLGKFLMNLANDQWEDVTSRLIGLMLQDQRDVTRATWTKVGYALLSAEVDDSVVEPLENLARSLEQEQARALTRIRGSSH